MRFIVALLLSIAPAHAQWMNDYGAGGSAYFRSPAEKIAPYKFVFAWSQEQRAVAWQALQELKDWERPCLVISFSHPNRCHPYTQFAKVTVRGNINYDILKSFKKYVLNHPCVLVSFTHLTPCHPFTPTYKVSYFMPLESMTNFSPNHHEPYLIGMPGYDAMLIGRTLRIQEDMKSDATFPDYLLRLTGALALGTDIGIPRNVELTTGLIPRELTLPEAILAGHALSRFHCQAIMLDVRQGPHQVVAAPAYCHKVNAQAAAMMNDIVGWAQKP